jgi:hypothetical protein
MTILVDADVLVRWARHHPFAGFVLDLRGLTGRPGRVISRG